MQVPFPSVTITGNFYYSRDLDKILDFTTEGQVNYDYYYYDDDYRDEKNVTYSPGENPEAYNTLR